MGKTRLINGHNKPAPVVNEKKANEFFRKGIMVYIFVAILFVFIAGICQEAGQFP
jgi:hypothetical protein